MDVERVAALVGAGGEADDVLRAVVAELASAPGISWAGIAFVEQGSLVLGPEAGEPEESRRRLVSIPYGGDTVAELRVDGDADDASLGRVARLLGPHCLVGWDTGGIPWGDP
ncbi:MAG TPA: hypothetical protein VFR32_10930 [Gaiellaceae bacterium]|nr:hypothetical protein [Gaiellaceae bacterium]